ncbi:hypothetical protein CHS0354_019795 [Potamilus streckersoni]|uniref:RRM domain-containing protein n=1 Tax=Potamilus streckersoni TaxID=2493646 RepID=A0AAE0SUS0_9BIVA|nr:hypothetical protein CHS0354_019795 [Potamilus streckersoni]
MAEKRVREKAASSEHELETEFVEGQKWKGNYALKRKVKDEPIKKIKVTKLPDGAVEETLMNYFENMRRNGGGPIETIEYHPATSSAIIEFQEADAVDRVLKKQPLLFLKKQISVEEYVEEKEEPPSCTIEVQGFVKNTTEDMLEMYFENSKRSGGGEVVGVVIECGVALVTFADENVASSVCEREHTLGGRKLNVSLHLPKKKSSAVEAVKVEEDAVVPVCTVEVRGYKMGSEATIELYFENAKRSGGDEIVKFDPFDSDGVIFITFASKEVARRVSELERQHVVAGCTLDVKLYEPPKCKSTLKLPQICSKEPEESVPHCTIAVRAVTRRMIETVPLYFENKKRSGGDEIVKFEYNEENEIAYITYESEEVARRVVKLGQHKLEGLPLKVKLFIPPQPRPHYEDRVLLEQLTSKITRDSLTNFLEARIGLTPSEIFFGDEGDKAVIIFNEKIDFQKLEEACKQRSLEGKHLQPSKVHVSNCILVLNLKITTTEDEIELYFENEKRSWGGPVEKVEFKREEEYCLVYFEDHAICEQVLQRKHKIDGSELHIFVYYECLGRISEDDNRPHFKSPKSVKLEQLVFAKTQFQMKSDVQGGLHQVKGQALKVTLDKPPTSIPTYNNKVLLAGLPSNVNTNCLSNFLEVKIGQTPVHFLYNKEMDKVIITFKDTIDFEKLEEACKKRPVEGSYLKPSKVHFSNCIIISHLQTTTTDDMIAFYFENKARSSGGPVEKVEFKRKEGYCLVFFEDHTSKIHLFLYNLHRFSIILKSLIIF